MSLYRTDAVVLRTHKLGEADRIVTFHTKTRGKVRAVAKGVRRTTSRFGARLEPASLVHVQCYEGRNLDIVTQVETIRALPNLRADLTRYGRAAVMLEAVDHLSQEGESDPARHKLLTGALTELDRAPSAVLVPAFVTRLLALEGVQPIVDHCASCGAEPPLEAFALHLGGALCRSCRQGDALSEAARTALASVIEGRVRHVLETTPPDVAAELEALASRMMEEHLERRLRAAPVAYQHLDDRPAGAATPTT